MVLLQRKKPINTVAQKMYTLFTHQYKGAVCILFLGHSVYFSCYVFIIYLFIYLNNVRQPLKFFS
jgi:hypothetical protein